MEEEQRELPIFVWWDVQSCVVPRGYDPLRIYGAIKSTMENLGIWGYLQVEAVGVGKWATKDMIDRFLATGIRFVPVDTMVEDGNQYKIFTSIGRWKRLQYPRGSVVVIISDDCGYSPILRSLRESGFRTFTFSTPDWYENLLPLGPRLDPDNMVLLLFLFWRVSSSLASNLVTTWHKNRMMLYAPRATKDALAKAPTWVLWEINRCPVPADVDAGIIGSCIKRAVNNLGYTGPLTITAIGILSDVPLDLLQAVFSSGIGLKHITGDNGIDLELLLWGWKNPPPANVILISYYRLHAPTFTTLRTGGYNVIQSICSASDPTSFWESLLAMLRAGELKLEEGDKCSENPAFVCSTCDGKFDVKDFQSFITHLSSPEHEREDPYFPEAHYDSYDQKEDATSAQKMMIHPKAPTDAQAKAPTRVWWDINRCPVPTDFDVRIIGPCIKSAVNNLGYMGPLTITAIGILTDLPLDVLRAIYSSGIALHHVPTDMNGIKDVLYRWSNKNPSPTNVMLLSGERVFGSTLERLESNGHNIIRSLFSYDARKVDSTLNLSFTSEGCFFLWRSLLTVLRSDIDGLDTDERGESALVCSTCDDLKVDAKDFERFSTHLYSREHGLNELEFYPQDCSSFEKEDATMIKDVLTCFRAGLRSSERKAEEELKAEDERKAELYRKAELNAARKTLRIR